MLLARDDSIERKLQRAATLTFGMSSSSSANVCCEQSMHTHSCCYRCPAGIMVEIGGDAIAIYRHTFFFFCSHFCRPNGKCMQFSLVGGQRENTLLLYEIAHGHGHINYKRLSASLSRILVRIGTCGRCEYSAAA